MKKFEYKNEGLGTIRPENLSNAPSELEMENSDLAKRVAAQGMVLLQNKNNTLPIDCRGAVAVYGGAAYATVKGGSGSGAVNQRENISVYQGFQRAGYEVISSAWLDEYGKEYDRVNPEERIMERYGLIDFVPEALFEPERVREEAKKTEIGIYVIGRNSGEGKDRKKIKGDYYLSDTEYHNIKCVAENYAKCIVILNVGGIIDMKFLEEIPGIGAVLLMSQAGQRGGDAVAEVLNATVPPCGKLTDTWSVDYEDYPSSPVFADHDGNAENEPYIEGIFVGYRYFDTFQVKPVFEFGYGLTYTDFSIETVRVELISFVDQHGKDVYEVQADIAVENTGKKWRGREVVQIYVSEPENEKSSFGKIEKPYQKLVAFAKTDWLEPGQRQILSIHFPLTLLTSYSEKQQAYVMESGEYILRIGNSSRNTQEAAVLSLEQEVVVEQLKNVYTNNRDYQIAADVVKLRKDGKSVLKNTGKQGVDAAVKRLVVDAKKLRLINGIVPAQNHSTHFPPSAGSCVHCCKFPLFSENIRLRPMSAPYLGSATSETPGYVAFVKIVDTDIFDRAMRDRVVVKDGENVLERSMPVAELADRQNGVSVERDRNTGKTVVRFRGHYKYSKVSLGDLQKSVICILKVAMASSNFAVLYNAYQEHLGREKRIHARAWTTDTYQDMLINYNRLEKQGR